MAPPSWAVVSTISQPWKAIQTLFTWASRPVASGKRPTTALLGNPFLTKKVCRRSEILRLRLLIRRSFGSAAANRTIGRVLRGATEFISPLTQVRPGRTWDWRKPTTSDGWLFIQKIPMWFTQRRLAICGEQIRNAVCTKHLMAVKRGIRC